MYRLYWKCIHAAYCIFFGLAGIIFLWAMGTNPYTLEFWVPLFVGIAVLSLPIGYLLHRHKRPWMTVFMMWLTTISINLFLVPLLFWIVHLLWPETERVNPQAVVIFLILTLAWAYWGIPRWYRRTIRPYMYGIAAKGSITHINDRIEGGSLTPLKYLFTYAYTDQNNTPHEGKNYTIAVPRLDALKVGDEIEILYDPKHPEVSVWPMG